MSKVIVEISGPRSDAFRAPLGKRVRLARSSDDPPSRHLQCVQQMMENTLAELAAGAGNEQIWTRHITILWMNPGLVMRLEIR